MTKIFRLCLSFFAFFPLCNCFSCTKISHRNNYFLEGLFSGVNMKNEDMMCYLKVDEISQDEYEAANGINVVNDLVKFKYYSLDFYTTINDEEEVHYGFVNLRDWYNGATGTPIKYVDDNGSNIYPAITDDKYAHKNYIIHFYNEHKVEIILCSLKQMEENIA